VKSQSFIYFDFQSSFLILNSKPYFEHFHKKKKVNCPYTPITTMLKVETDIIISVTVERPVIVVIV